MPPHPSRPRAVALLLGLCAALVAALCLTLSAGAVPALADSVPVTDLSGDFEAGTVQGWTARASETVAVSTAVAHQGTGSLAVTGRTASWQGASLDLLGTLQPGTAYTLTVWVRLAAGESATPARLSMERQSGGTTGYETVASGVTATADGWVKLSGTYTLAGTPTVLKAYVETASGTPSFHIDDFTLTHLPAVPVQQDIPSLKDVLAADFTVGAAVLPAEVTGDHGTLVKKHFGSVTPGNAMKWDATEPTEGTFRYTDADATVDFAAANGIKVRGHTLVWHQQTPAWVFQDAAGNAMTATPENKALLLSRLEAHIRAVMGHYKGEISAWDVVNEVIDETQSDGLRRSPWYQITGTDYIADAFRTAREVDPAAELCINDYNTTVPAKRQALYNLVSSLRLQGVPVDCVGHQMHGNIDWPSASDTTATVEQFAALGVDQQITEMDVSVYTDNTSSYTTIPDSALTKQAAEYKALFDVYRSHRDAISSVTLWGVADDNTWLNSFPVNRMDAPLLFDRQLQAKAAYWALVGNGTASPSPSTPPPGDVQAPSVPAGLTVRATTASGATLTWTASTDDTGVTGYDVYRDGARVATATATAYTDSGLAASTAYRYTVRARDAAGNVSADSAAVTATTTAAPTGGGCTAAYRVDSDWGGGFVATVSVTNTGSTATTSWRVTWTWGGDQKVVNAWNATAVQSGASVTAASMGYNGSLAPGAGTSFGFQGSRGGSNPVPVLTCTAA
ncbi:endo-1,4-beta-xylanase [Kitasatospora sp. NBC_01539]|uniref:endo-1,4-beta-xylanase n=1 Tax=Kitasatospora sp. NBC_01539 TaxID=2903577 RepID=UPI0038602C02